MDAVATHDLTRRFGHFTAVDRVSFSIPAGSVFGFLGPNGSGKTTTIRMLCGILEPTSGSAEILGMDLLSGREAIKADLGYMSQKFSLYDDLTAAENLDFYAGMFSLPRALARERIETVVRMAGLSGRTKERVAGLSGGIRQRLALGCAILHRPRLLFLDEPTSGVDPRSRRRFWDIIYDLASSGTTVMVTTHFMDEAEHCDAIGFMYDGGYRPRYAREAEGLVPGSVWRSFRTSPWTCFGRWRENRGSLTSPSAGGASTSLRSLARRRPCPWRARGRSSLHWRTCSSTS